MNTLFRQFSSAAISNSDALNIQGGATGGTVACTTCNTAVVWCKRCTQVECGGSTRKGMNCGNPLSVVGPGPSPSDP
jgi:hypothetical protein